MALQMAEHAHSQRLVDVKQASAGPVHRGCCGHVETALNVDYRFSLTSWNLDERLHRIPPGELGDLFKRDTICCEQRGRAFRNDPLGCLGKVRYDAQVKVVKVAATGLCVSMHVNCTMAHSLVTDEDHIYSAPLGQLLDCTGHRSHPVGAEHAFDGLKAKDGISEHSDAIHL